MLVTYNYILEYQIFYTFSVHLLEKICVFTKFTSTTVSICHKNNAGKNSVARSGELSPIWRVSDTIYGGKNFQFVKLANFGFEILAGS